MKYLLKLVCISCGMMMFFGGAYSMEGSNNEMSVAPKGIASSKGATQNNTWSEDEKEWEVPEAYDFLAQHSSHIEDQKTHRELVFTAGPEVSSPQTEKLFFTRHGDEAAKFFNDTGGDKSYLMLYLYRMGVLCFSEIKGKKVIYPLRKVTQDLMHELFDGFEELREMFRDDVLGCLYDFRAKNSGFGRWAAQSSRVVETSLRNPSVRNDLPRKWDVYCSLFAKYKMGWATPESELFKIKEKK